MKELLNIFVRGLKSVLGLFLFFGLIIGTLTLLSIAITFFPIPSMIVIVLAIIFLAGL